MTAGSPQLRRLSRLLGGIEQSIDDLRVPVPKDVRDRLSRLRRMVLDSRPPALVLVGRRGSGKSTLVNAIFGAPVAATGAVRAQTAFGWHEYRGDRGSLRLLDTRGVQEGSAPVEADAARSPIQSILAQLKTERPDALMFLIKAKEIDAAIDADLDALDRIVGELRRLHKHVPAVFGVVTHCDELTPKNTSLHGAGDPGDLAEKQANVAAAEARLLEKLRGRARVYDAVSDVIGVCALMEWRADGTLRTDERWRVGDLVSRLFDGLPDEARVELARVSQVRALQHTIAQSLTGLAVGVTAAIAALPLPVGDLLPITSTQVTLVTGIAYVAGRTLDRRAAVEFLAAIGVNVGAGFALREAARALARFVVPGGALLSSAVAAAGTLAIGRAATAYFVDGASPAEARRLYTMWRARPAEEEAMAFELEVEGMTCEGCAGAVERVVRRIPCVTSVTVQLDRGRVRVEGEPDRAAVAAAISKAGYRVA